MFLLIVAGPPGSGKGTQAKLIAKEFDLVHISTGELLREEIAKGTKLGKFASECIDDGGFVPDNVACDIVANFLENNNLRNGCVFDGFPRTIAQCEKLNEISEAYQFDKKLIFNLNVNEDALITRIEQRNLTGSRPDDCSRDIINFRFKLYKQLSEPMIKWFETRSLLRNVNGEGTPEKVFGEIKLALKDFIK